MSTRYFFASVPVECTSDDPADAAKAANALWERLVEGPLNLLDPKTYRFFVPSHLPGSTIDSLLNVTSELPEVRAILSWIESLSRRVCREIQELEKYMGCRSSAFTLEGVASEAYVSSFIWDQEKYPVTSSLDSVYVTLQADIAKLIKKFESNAERISDVRNAHREMNNNHTKRLHVRDLSSLVNPSDFTFSDFLTTVLVVMPKNSQQKCLETYELLDREFVVARSSELLYEDEQDALYNVTMFTHVLDKFKVIAKENGFMVRDEYNLQVLQSKQEELENLSSKSNKLLHCLHTLYSEVVPSWIHVCALLVYAESRLRFGRSFPAFAGLSTPRNEATLKQFFAEDFAGSSAMGREPFHHVINLV